VKIKGTHSVCGREVLVSQIIENGGHCPWDGLPFNKDYTANLTEALAKAEIAGSALENALEEAADMHGTLSLDPGSILSHVQTQIGTTQPIGSTKARAR
jgi:hypothetical protein